MESFTITFSGDTSVLESVFFPPIDLVGQYQIGLVDLQTYNTIYNVKKPNNVLYYYEPKIFVTTKGNVLLSSLNNLKGFKVELDNRYNVKIDTKLKLIYNKGVLPKLLKTTTGNINIEDGEDIYYYEEKDLKTITLPEGCYEVVDILREVQKSIPDFQLIINNKTMKCTLFSSMVFDFTKVGLGTDLLGFTGVSTPDQEYESKNKVNINNVNVIRIECNIASGSYLNGKPSHTIHEFYPSSPPGYKIIEVPKNIIYFPVTKRTLDSVTISLVDQNDNIINFNGEEITVRFHIVKKL